MNNDALHDKNNNCHRGNDNQVTEDDTIKLVMVVLIVVIKRMIPNDSARNCPHRKDTPRITVTYFL